jgi:virginiamycin B lyase
LRGVCVAPDGDLWFTANFADQIGWMKSNGRMFGEYPIQWQIPEHAVFCAWPDGRLFFTTFDAGLIGEVIPQ